MMKKKKSIPGRSRLANPQRIQLSLPVCGEELLVNEAIIDVGIGMAKFNNEFHKGFMPKVGCPGCDNYTMEWVDPSPPKGVNLKANLRMRLIICFWQTDGGNDGWWTKEKTQVYPFDRVAWKLGSIHWNRSKKDFSYVKLFEHIVEHEYQLKIENSRKLRLVKARIPKSWSLKHFHSIDSPIEQKENLSIYDSFDYMVKHKNVIWIGPTGTGKSGLATAFLIQAINKDVREVHSFSRTCWFAP